MRTPKIIEKIEDLEQQILNLDFSGSSSGGVSKPAQYETLHSILKVNSEYYIGELTSDTILEFPSTANRGDTIYINFSYPTIYSITILGNISDIDIDPEEGKYYELFAHYNGIIWILGYNEYTVTDTVE